MGKYDGMNVAALKAECKARGITGYSKLRRADLVERLETRDSTEALALSDAEVDEVVEFLQPESKPEPPEITDQEWIERHNQAAERDRKRKARNKAKARRRALRARGFQAGY